MTRIRSVVARMSGAWTRNPRGAAPGDGALTIHGDRLAVVLCVRPQSPSLAYRSYNDVLANEPFVCWCVRRLTSMLPEAVVYVMCRLPEEEAELTALLGGMAQVVRTPAATTLQAFAEVSAAMKVPHVAFVAEGVAFAPEHLLRRVFAHHLAHSNSHTPVVGFPAGTTPDIYSSAFLARLRRLPAAYRTAEPSALAVRLASRRGLAARLSPVRAVPFNAAAAYGALPGDLPERVSIIRPRDIVLARRVVSAGSAERLGLGELRAWRHGIIEMREQRRHELRKRTALLSRQVRIDVSEPRRVLVVSNPSAFSGAEASLSQFLSHIDRARFAVTALIGQEGLFTERLRQAGVTVMSPSHGFGGPGEENFAYMLATCLEVRPDLIHFNSPSGLPSLYCASLLQMPIVVHCRQAGLEHQRDLLRAADAVITVSEYVKRQVLRFEVAADRVRVIYNGVDTDRFAPGRIGRDAARAHLRVPRDAKVVLMIARFDPYKRHDLFVRAVELAKRRVPGLFMLLVGEAFGEGAGVYDRVVEYMHAHGMAAWATIVPFVADTRELHEAADVLVLCSDGEPLGRCVLEGMAMANPVIVNDSGGNQEVVRHAETGLVVPYDNAARLADAIVQIVEDEGLAQRLGLAARASVATLTNERTANRIMAVYDELLGRTVPREVRASMLNETRGRTAVSA